MDTPPYMRPCGKVGNYSLCLRGTDMVTKESRQYTTTSKPDTSCGGTGDGVDHDGHVDETTAKVDSDVTTDQQSAEVNCNEEHANDYSTTLFIRNAWKRLSIKRGPITTIDRVSTKLIYEHLAIIGFSQARRLVNHQKLVCAQFFTKFGGRLYANSASQGGARGKPCANQMLSFIKEQTKSVIFMGLSNDIHGGITFSKLEKFITLLGEASIYGQGRHIVILGALNRFRPPCLTSNIIYDLNNKLASTVTDVRNKYSAQISYVVPHGELCDNKSFIDSVHLTKKGEEILVSCLVRHAIKFNL